MTNSRRPALFLTEIEAVAFDMDGVVTDTASVHAAAWQRTFDTLLSTLEPGPNTRPFDPVGDYLTHLDGRSRTDGVRAFLAARRINLPETSEGHSGTPSVASLARDKDRFFLEQVAAHGVRAFPSTLDLVRALRAAGAGVAVVTASRNCSVVLEAAGAADLFDARVDGVEAARLGLPGKPDPALFLEAARRLGRPASRTAVVEDALSGVTAGARGGFGLVVGVDRSASNAAGRREQLYRYGADVVVTDLAELRIEAASR
ncbi:HAD family hydrolase [Nocardiopsis metallicus]|uniref:HAD superfamily hydrolase (TIGR01509 family) n=1 Tax=Nocardiopsis metallicus TaxID=179819 RepID=A0A840VZX5_9ACTN|nr:HAD-IA family hydrolase [Nocardiopsis metallicus]MBB5490029.1 HAD superfamily hydrolase (TIGR01509 family) [Nocardiopsis metallicus]